MKHLLLACALLMTATLGAQVSDLEDLTTPRSGHQMIQLPSSKVLAAGGWTGEAYTASAEVYNGDSWTAVDPMSVNRYSFNLVLASDQAVAIGGWDGDVTNHASTEIFNDAFGIWEPGPALINGRSNCRSIVLQDGRVLVTGGFNGSEDLTSCELIDPSDWSVSTTGALNFARSSHALVLLQDGRVMAIGGFNPSLDFQMNACEIYDPSTGMWTAVNPLNTGRDNLAAVVRPDGNVVAIGGRLFDGANNWFAGQSEVEVYNPTAGTWTTAEPLAQGASYCDAYWRSAEDDVLLIGGTDLSGNGVTTTFAANQRNTFGPDNWDADPGIQTTGRFRQASCQLASGGILVSGGDDNGTVQLIGLFDATPELEAAVPLPFPNPATSTVTWESADPEATTWMHLDGQRMDVPYLGQGRWDVSELPAGMYLLGMENDGVPVYRRLSVR